MFQGKKTPLSNWIRRWRSELAAGLTGYLTTAYIVMVNGSLLHEAGLTLESGMVATILASFLGSVLMGVFTNLPLILIPGMGINVLFVYSIVENTSLSFEESLTVILAASILFIVTTITSIGNILHEAIPESLKHAITTGIGFFLILIGLEKSGLIMNGDVTIVTIGDFTSPEVLVALITLFIALFLFMKNIPAHLLITIIVGTILAYIFGIIDTGHSSVDVDLSESLYMPSFSAINQPDFWLSVFPLTIVLIFENMGILHGQLHMLNRENNYNQAFQVTAFSSLMCAFVGTSPTVSTAENAAVIASGGKTGKTAVTTGLLFLITLFIIPWITLIPDTAISPILIIVGILMAQNLRNISLNDLSETIPVLLLTVMIPFTYSIADGMAFGFITYPIVKIAAGQRKELTGSLIIICALFVLYYLIKIIGL